MSLGILLSKVEGERFSCEMCVLRLHSFTCHLHNPQLLTQYFISAHFLWIKRQYRSTILPACLQLLTKVLCIDKVMTPHLNLNSQVQMPNTLLFLPKPRIKELIKIVKICISWRIKICITFDNNECIESVIACNKSTAEQIASCNFGTSTCTNKKTSKMFLLRPIGN